VGERNSRLALSGSRRARFQKDRQGHRTGAADTRHRAPGNGCGWGPKGMGKAETASRNKNVSGAADSGESRDGGTRAVSFSDPSYFKFRRSVGGADVPLGRRPPGQASVSSGRACGHAQSADQTCDPAERKRNLGEPTFAKCEIAVRGKSLSNDEAKEKSCTHGISHREAHR